MSDNNDRVRLVYMTAPDEATARRIATALVEEGLVACANVFPPGLSVYRWRGAVETASECVMILKTTVAALAALRTRALALHPHEKPAFVAVPVDHAASDAGFMSWIESTVA